MLQWFAVMGEYHRHNFNSADKGQRCGSESPGPLNPFTLCGSHFHYRPWIQEFTMIVVGIHRDIKLGFQMSQKRVSGGRSLEYIGGILCAGWVAGCFSLWLWCGAGYGFNNLFSSG